MSYYKTASDDSDTDEDNYNEPAHDSNVLIAIDCHASMFVPSGDHSESGFLTAIKAAHCIADSLILHKSKFNKIAIILFHSDASKRTMMRFEDKFVDAFVKLENLACKTSFDKLKDDYCDTNTTNNYNFAHFIIDCKRMLASVTKFKRKLFFITMDSDPCYEDENVKSQAIRELQEIKDRISYETLPLTEDFDHHLFFNEVNTLLGMKTSRFYYNRKHLIAKLQEEVTFKAVFKSIKLMLFPTAPELGVDCFMQKTTKNPSVLPNHTLTRDFKREVISKPAQTDFLQPDETKHSIKMAYVSESVTTEEKSEIMHVDDVSDNIGIQLEAFSKQRLSEYGYNWNKNNLLRAKADDDKTFNAAWQYCADHDVTMICNIVYMKKGRVHRAELIPILLNGDRRYFHVMHLPTSMQLLPQWKKEKEEEASALDDDDDELAKMMDDLVDAATITDFDITKIRPHGYIKKAQYLKKELLGDDYTLNDDEFGDLVTERETLPDDVNSITAKLAEMFPIVVKRKGKAPAKEAKKPKT